MENVGIYTPPSKNKPVIAGMAMSGEQFQVNLTVEDLEVTQSAQDKLKEIVTQSEDEVSAIRIYIGGGGCSGMTYGMTFTDEQTVFDTVLAFDGFKVFVDVVALNDLRGCLL